MKTYNDTNGHGVNGAVALVEFIIRRFDEYQTAKRNLKSTVGKHHFSNPIWQNRMRVYKAAKKNWQLAESLAIANSMKITL